ncbi:MAG: acyltransferase family protein, partial [Acidimicrobiia bacterium]
FRRLLPALFLVMVGIIVYAGVFAAPGELGRIRADTFATLGYVANWRFVFSGQSYFDQFAQPSPLRHMWSLAIEEQFYLIWPLIVCFLLWWRRSLRVLIGACIAMIVTSAGLMALLYQPGHDPSRVYYGTDTRAQSLLIGAIVGILLFQHGPIRSLYWRTALRVAALVGAGYTLWLFWGMSERTDSLYQGGFLFAAIAVSAVIASVVQPDRGVLGAALSWGPLRWIGRISYGLYLWHWPVYLTLTHARTGLDGVALLLVRLAVSVGFAAVSYYAIEKPIRQRTFRLPRPAVLVPLAVASIVVAIVTTTAGSQESTAASITQALRAGAHAPQAKPPDPHKAGARAATTPAAPAPKKVLLVGDSVLASLGLGFDTVGPGANLLVWNRGRLGCGLLTEGDLLEGGEVKPIDPGCDWHQVWQSNVDEFQPDVVVMLVGAWDVPDHLVNGQWLRVGTVEYDQYFLSELDRATALLGSRGAKVVVLTSPFFSRPELVGQTGREWPEYDPWRVDRINALYRDFAVAHPGRFTIVDLNRFVSAHGKYAADLNGVQIRDDGVHFSHDGAVMVDQWLAPQLTAIADGKPDPQASTVQYDSRGLWAR